MSTVKRVFIQGPGGDAYARMFYAEGFAGAVDIESADIVCFTGGEDVDPGLYNEHAIPESHFSIHRDELDIEAYWTAYGLDKFMVGICRGGQFLNVMNDGRLWQDVDNHCRSHMAHIIESSTNIWVSSTHHQQIRPTEEAIVLAIANESMNKKTWLDTWSKLRNPERPEIDVEVCYYEDSKSLCFQPHPEFPGFDQCRKFLFDCIKRFDVPRVTPAKRLVAEDKKV